VRADRLPRRRRRAVSPGRQRGEHEGYELAVFHSHLTSPPRPSRTDVENIGLWLGKPYVILSLARDELAGWRITERGIEPLPVTAAA